MRRSTLRGWIPLLMLPGLLSPISCGRKHATDSVAGWARQAAASASDQVHPGRSALFEFDLASDSRSDLGVLFREDSVDGAPEAPSSASADVASLRVRGRLRRLDLSAGAEEGIVRLGFDDLRAILALNGVTLAEYGQALSRDAVNPFHAVFDAEGRVDSLFFSPGSTEAYRQLACLISSYLQVAVPESASGTAWSAREHDVQGLVLADYTAREAPLRHGQRGPVCEITRTKTSYLLSDLRQHRGDLALDVRLQPSGATTYRCAEDRGGIDSLFAGEAFVSMMAGRAISRTETRLTMACLTREETGKRQWQAYLAEFTRLRARLDARPLYVPVSREAALRAAGEAALGDATVGGLLATLRESVGAASSDSLDVLYRRLKAGLSVYPGDSGAAGEAILASGSHPRFADVVIKALAEAGTEEGQAALIAVAREAGDPRTRERAVTELGLVQEPTADTEEALIGLAGSAESPGDPAAILALGNVAGTLRDLKPNRSENLTRILVRELSRCDEAGTRVAFLLAIGNSGHPVGLAAVRAGCEDSSPRIRRAAATALRFFPGAEPDSLLTDILLGDPEAVVRESAATAMGFRPAGERQRESTVKALRSDPNETVCLAALRNLIRWRAQHPELDEVIREATRHPHEAVRKLASDAGR